MKTNGQSYLKFLIFMAIFLLVVVVILVVVKPRINSNVLISPYFSSDYVTVGKNNEWVLKNFQPQLIDFESRNSSNYLIAEYIDIGNYRRKVKIFVTGQTPDGNYIDKIFLHYADRQGEWLEFGELKKKLVKGEQIRIEYLIFNGLANDKTSCQEYLNFCALASILEDQQLEGKLEDILKNNESDILVVPGNVISLQLYEK